MIGRYRSHFAVPGFFNPVRCMAVSAKNATLPVFIKKVVQHILTKEVRTATADFVAFIPLEEFVWMRIVPHDAFKVRLAIISRNIIP